MGWLSLARGVFLAATNVATDAAISGAAGYFVAKDSDRYWRESDPKRIGKETDRPPAQSGPQHIGLSGWWEIAKRTFNEVQADRVQAVAGGVTFFGLFALFPAITALVSIYGLFADRSSISAHLGFLAGFLPEGAMSIISDQISRITSGSDAGLSLALALSLALSLWSANAATKSVIEALNIAYDVEDQRSFFKLNAVSLGLTASAIIGLILLIGIVAVIPALVRFLSLGWAADLLLLVGRWPAMFLLLLVALDFLYQFGPNRPDVKWKWITPGSLAAATGLVLFSILFSWYAANFGKFNETYGSLGAVIGFMTWLWLAATIVIIGAEFNAEVERQASPKPRIRGS